MKPLNQIGTFFAVVLLACICSLAQDSAAKKSPEQKQKPERKVWVRLKSGQILAGDLVKMDTESVDFTVKGILQTVTCDDLIGVMFVHPTPRPTSTPALTPTPKTAPTPTEVVPEQADSPANQGERCVQNRTRKITLRPGQYTHAGFSNTKRDFGFRGDFTAFGGKITVYITDAEGYADFVNGKKFTVYHSMKKVTEGSFNLNLKQGSYDLIWFNESTVESRVIEAELCFVYSEQ